MGRVILPLPLISIFQSHYRRRLVRSHWSSLPQKPIIFNVPIQKFLDKMSEGSIILTQFTSGRIKRTSVTVQRTLRHKGSDFHRS